MSGVEGNLEDVDLKSGTDMGPKVFTVELRQIKSISSSKNKLN